jgi:hypothetical protein
MSSYLVVFTNDSEETCAYMFMGRPAEGGSNFVGNTDKQGVTLHKAAAVPL